MFEYLKENTVEVNGGTQTIKKNQNEILEQKSILFEVAIY